jgi:hypothetical protein
MKKGGLTNCTLNVFHELCYYYNFIFVVKTLLRNNNFYYKKIEKNVKIRKCIRIVIRNKNNFFTANKCSPSFY